MSEFITSGRATYDPTYVPHESYENLDNEATSSRSLTVAGVSEDDNYFASVRNSTSNRNSLSNNRNSLGHQADHDELKRIATTATHRSSMHRVDTLALPPDDPTRDPTNKKFDLYKWARNFLNDLDHEGLRSVRSGVVFKDLSVSGSGAALQLQSTVFSMLLDPIRNLSFKSKPHRQILSKFNGFLASGELLIVLGRPGSGCSTFLKTICGELHGLNLDSSSEIHYNGVPQKQMIKNFKGEVVYNQEVCYNSLGQQKSPLEPSFTPAPLGRQAFPASHCWPNA